MTDNIIDVPVPQNSSYGVQEAGTLLEYDSTGAISCFDYSLLSLSRLKANIL